MSRSVFAEAMQWLADHPEEAAIGTVVTIAGVAMTVVLLAGGALGFAS